MSKKEKIVHAIVYFLMKHLNVNGVFLTKNKVSVDIDITDAELAEAYESIVAIVHKHGRTMHFVG